MGPWLMLLLCRRAGIPGAALGADGEFTIGACVISPPVLAFMTLVLASGRFREVGLEKPLIAADGERSDEYGGGDHGCRVERPCSAGTTPCGHWLCRSDHLWRYLSSVSRTQPLW